MLKFVDLARFQSEERESLACEELLHRKWTHALPWRAFE